MDFIAVRRQLGNFAHRLGIRPPERPLNHGAFADIDLRCMGGGNVFFRHHLEKQILGHGVHRIGINDKLVVFAPGGRIILVGADFIGFRRQRAQIQHAKAAHAAHPLFEGMLLVFIRHDPQKTIVRECGQCFGRHAAVFRQQRLNTKIRAGNIVLF